MSDSQRPEGKGPGPDPASAAPPVSPEHAPVPELPPTREGEAPPTLPNIPSLESSPTLRHLAGRYVVLDMLGQGGMSIVLAAYDVRLDRRVALKLLRSRSDSEPLQFQPRLVREAQAMARLNHPHVVAVYDAGTLEDGTFFIAMEYVEGQTLRQWCQQSCSWRQVLAMYLAAGRGLAAAHAAGLVHRDFKPDNVLVGKDGRVRVTDFGLARVAAMPVLTLSPTMPDALALLAAESNNSQVGALVGTPGYMAPELLRGHAADERSDLFAFCVALYESLYGQPAFPGANATERFRSQREGRLNPPPPTSPVPAWVSRIVLRGLAEHPQARPASMEALIAALELDPEARRRGWVRSGALVAGTLGLVALAAVGWVRQQGSDCARTEQRLAGVWDSQQQKRVRQALEGTGLPYAQDTARRVHAALEGYARDWVRLRTDACEASRGQRSQPQALVLSQVGCLERRRSQLRALVELLGQRPDKELLPKAIEAARLLPPLEQCLDSTYLGPVFTLPEDPEARARVEGLQGEVDRLEALWAAGKYREGLVDAEKLLPKVLELEHAPPQLKAHALFEVGRLYHFNSHYTQAESLLRRAVVQAAQAGDGELEARAWNSLLWILAVEQPSPSEQASLTQVQTALEAAMERAGRDMVRAEALHVLGGMLYRQGRYREALEHFRQAEGLMTRDLGPTHPFVAVMINNQGVVLADLGELAQARDRYERALELQEEVLGPENPVVANTLTGLGRTLLRLGLLEEACTQLTSALHLGERSLGPHHPQLAETLLGLAECHRARAQPALAIALLERALKIPNPSGTAEVKAALAPLLWQTDRPRARTLAAEAHDHFQRLGNLHEAQKLQHLLDSPAGSPR